MASTFTSPSAAGTITADQATQLTNDLATKITNFVDTNRPEGPGGRGR